MKQILISSILVITLAGGACSHKYATDVTAQGMAIDKSNQYIAALSDFQDGVSAAFYSGWLSGHVTVIVAMTLKDAVEVIHATPNGAKAAALAGLDSIASQLSTDPQLQRFLPYLDSARSVVRSL